MNPNPICALPNAHLTRPSLDLNASAENKSGIIQDIYGNSRKLWKILENFPNCRSFSKLERDAQETIKYIRRDEFLIKCKHVY